MNIPYNPNPYPPGVLQPIPVYPYVIPPPPHDLPRMKWTPIPPPPKPKVQPTLTTFPLFQFLPPELRCRIWSFSCPTRVLEIRSWGTTRYAPIRYSVHPHRPPTIFRVCKESRLEASRIYRPVHIGVSAAVKLDSRTYVPWKYHPTNPAAEGMTVGTAPLPYAEPYPPVAVRVNWDRDIIYLGPEFQRCHLLPFLTSSPPGFELPGLQRLALGHKMFTADADGRWDTLCMALWSLHSRHQFRELMIVPDDERNALVDRWYYGKHEIELKEPEWGYSFTPQGASGVAKGFVDGLREWFERLWNPSGSYPALTSSSASSSSSSSSTTSSSTHSSSAHLRLLDPAHGHAHNSNKVEDDDTASIGTLTSDDHAKVIGRRPPDVTVKSVRRDRRRMAEFKDGIWEIQEAIGDMRVWKTWSPPEDQLE